MTTGIRNGTIVTPSDQYTADILIDGERIAAIGSGIADKADFVIDAKDKLIFPGGIDGHTHFNGGSPQSPMTGYETSPAAVLGGTTCVVNFAPQDPALGLLDSALKHRQEAEGVSAVDFALHSVVMYPKDSIFNELRALVEAGIPSIKLFMAYKGTPLYSSDEVILRMLRKSSELGILTMIHAENADIIADLQRQLLSEGKTEPRYHAVSRPTIAEAEAVYRTCMLAKAAQAPVFIVHVSCKEAMEIVRDSRMRGDPVFGETCPHYLTLGVENLARPGFEGAKYVCSPPLREHAHHDPLWSALQQGWLQTAGSDHCGIRFAGQKELGLGDFTKIPNGCPGVENRLAILYGCGVRTGKLSLQRMVDVFAAAPAKMFGLDPCKGGLLPGGDADIVVFDPCFHGRINNSSSLQGLDYTPFEGMEQVGRVEKVLLRGKLCVEGGKYIGTAGQGKFIHRRSFGAAYNGRGRTG
jgi:dihydropyrimidinase